jgi:hypothetical protein
MTQKQALSVIASKAKQSRKKRGGLKLMTLGCTSAEQGEAKNFSFFCVRIKKTDFFMPFFAISFLFCIFVA